MRKKLSATFIETVKPGPKRAEYHDTSCVGLSLQVTPLGSKSFPIRGRIRGGDGTSRKLATLPFSLGLEKARKEARKILELAAEGIDPREARKAAALAKAESQANALAAVVAQYLKVEGKRGLRSLDQVEYTLRKYVLPILGAKPIPEIRRSDAARLRDTILAGGNDRRPRIRTAERAIAHLSLVLNWHAERHDHYINPLVRAFKSKARKRDRTLTDAEILSLWRATEPVPGRHEPFRALVRALLLTGRRRAELAAMTWAEITPEGDHLLPATRSKNGVALLSPLSAAARAIIEAQPRLGPYVFSVSGPRPLTDFTANKEALDQRMRQGLRDELPRWTLHDLRRTCRTLMARLRIPDGVAEACLGHKLGGVAGIYNRHAYREEKREAYAKLGAEIARIVGVSVAVDPPIVQHPYKEPKPHVTAGEIVATPWGLIHG